MRFVDRGQLAWNAFEQRALLRRSVLQLLGFFFSFDGLPVLNHFFWGRGGLVAKHMRMPPDKLIGDLLNHGVDVELRSFFSKLGMKNHVKQQVTELLGQTIVVLIVDGLEYFVHFFNQHRFKRAEILLFVPRTAIWATQRRHDLDEPVESLPCCVFAVAGHNRIISAVLHSYADESRNLIGRWRRLASLCRKHWQL